MALGERRCPLCNPQSLSRREAVESCGVCGRRVCPRHVSWIRDLWRCTDCANDTDSQPAPPPVSTTVLLEAPPIFCYQRPLTRAPSHAGPQSFTAMLRFSDPVIGSVWHGLSAHPENPVAVTLAALAARLNLPGTREVRLQLWEAIETLALWRVRVPHGTGYSYAPPLTIIEARIETDVRAFVLGDVREIVVSLSPLVTKRVEMTV